MSLLDYKITDQSVQGVYVQSQPDRLTGTPQQNKAAFDAYPALIRKQFNLLVDALGGTTAAGEIPIQSINGVQAQNVQQALAAIQQNLTAYINKLKATTGAAEVGVSTISGISAGNVQKALEGLRTIQITLDSNIKKLMSANGAATVGVNKISGIQAQNVQNALEELRKAIDDSVSGIIPGGSITADMLADDVNEILLYKMGLISNLPTDLANLPAQPFIGLTDKSGVTGLPESWDQSRCDLIRFWCGNLEYTLDFIASYANKKLAYRLATGKWAEIATATSPEETSLPLMSGVSPSTQHGGYKCVFSKDQFGKVYITLGVQGTFQNGQSIFTLPPDCSPNENAVINAYTDGYAAFIKIGPNGVGVIYTNVFNSQFEFIYASGELDAAQ